MITYLNPMILLVITLLALTPPRIAAAKFYHLRDVNPSADYFSGTVGEEDEKGGYRDTHRIERHVLERPVLDGPPGSNRLVVKKLTWNADTKEPWDNVEEKKLFGIKAEGQYSLFGYDSKQTSVYAYHLGGHMHCDRLYVIKSILVFSPNYPKGNIIGPKGNYQYASCSPDGRYCILVDYGGGKVTAVNLKDNIIKVLKIAVPHWAADPPRVYDEGKDSVATAGMESNLSGRYLMMVWDSMSSGRLLMRDLSGLLIKEFPIKINVAQRRVSSISRQKK